MKKYFLLAIIIISGALPAQAGTVVYNGLDFKTGGISSEAGDDLDITLGDDSGVDHCWNFNMQDGTNVAKICSDGEIQGGSLNLTGSTTKKGVIFTNNATEPTGVLGQLAMIEGHLKYYTDQWLELEILNDVYGSGWDGSPYAASRDAIYDKIEAVIVDIDDKSDKSNVLELDNTTAYTPTGDYHPATYKWCNDTFPTVTGSASYIPFLDASGDLISETAFKYDTANNILRLLGSFYLTADNYYYVNLHASASMSESYSLIFPTAAPSADGQVLSFTTAGVGSFSEIVTDLTVTRDSTAVNVNSSNGTNATLLAADASNAGVMTAADKTKLNALPASLDSPGDIGSGTPAAGHFTELTANSFDFGQPASGETGEITMLEDPDNGTNVCGWKSRANLATDLLWLMPAADGTDNQCFATDGALGVKFIDVLQPGNNLSDLTTPATARTNLGVEIGADVQAYDAALTDSTVLAEPDQLQPISDAWLVKYFPAESYPSGVTIDALHITTSETCTDILNFEEWAQDGTTAGSTVESITLSGTFTEDDGSIADDQIAADGRLMVNLPASPSDIAFCEITVVYHAN